MNQRCIENRFTYNKFKVFLFTLVISAAVIGFLVGAMTQNSITIFIAAILWFWLGAITFFFVIDKNLHRIRKNEETLVCAITGIFTLPGFLIWLISKSLFDLIQSFMREKDEERDPEIDYM